MNACGNRELQQSRTDVCKVASRVPQTRLTFKRLKDSTSDEFLLSRSKERLGYSFKIAQVCCITGPFGGIGLDQGHLQRAELLPPEYSVPVPELDVWNKKVMQSPAMLRAMAWLA
jgi:hypothetical protein